MVAVPSGGDQVFESHPKNNEPDIFEGFFNARSGRRAWVFQEKRKGESSFNGGSDYTYSSYSGWRFNDLDPPDGWNHYTPEDAAAIPESSLRTRPFFGMGEGEFRNLFADGVGTANAFLSQEDHGATNIHRIIAGAIPAMSLAVGRVRLKGEKIVIPNIDMNKSDTEDALKPPFWPYRGDKDWQQYNWLHSDIKNMAYLYTNRVYDYLVEQGGLK